MLSVSFLYTNLPYTELVETMLYQNHACPSSYFYSLQVLALFEFLERSLKLKGVNYSIHFLRLTGCSTSVVIIFTRIELRGPGHFQWAISDSEIYESIYSLRVLTSRSAHIAFTKCVRRFAQYCNAHSMPLLMAKDHGLQAYTVCSRLYTFFLYPDSVFIADLIDVCAPNTVWL